MGIDVLANALGAGRFASKLAPTEGALERSVALSTP